MLPVLFIIVLLSNPLAASEASAAEPLDQQRQQELVYLLHQDCGSCHGMTLKGGLGPPLLPEVMAAKPGPYLQQVISKGVAGKAMPPWENILTPQDIEFLVSYLQTGSNP